MKETVSSRFQRYWKDGSNEDYFGSRHAADGKKDGIPYRTVRGEVLDVPILDDSRWVYECEVERTIETGDSATFFCHIRNIQMDKRLVCRDPFDVDLTVLDPVIYSGKYHSLGKRLGDIGDFLPMEAAQKDQEKGNR